ncbi:hypothetical protein MHYP_G00247680 [Metynnis hypsauchen]
MSQSVPDGVNHIEKLDRGELVEMVGDIYENADAVKGHKPNIEVQDTNTNSNLQTQHTVSKDVTYNGIFVLFTMEVV